MNDAAGESVRISLSGGFTDYLVHNWLNRMFRNQAFTKPATYVALATSLIDDNDVVIGDVTEVKAAAVMQRAGQYQWGSVTGLDSRHHGCPGKWGGDYLSQRVGHGGWCGVCFSLIASVGRGIS